MGSLSEEKRQPLKKPILPDRSNRSYVMHVRRLQKQFSFHNSDIIAMDETPLWNDMVSNTTVEVTGSKEVAMKSTGHDKVRVTVCLAGKVDGSKCKSLYRIQRSQKRKQALHEEFKRTCSVALRQWMDE